MASFWEVFDRRPVLLASAPGRVNLIGEHTDYNDGFVLPLAVSQRVWVAAAPRTDNLLRLFSLNEAERVEVRLDQLAPQGNWSDYPLGVIHQLAQRRLLSRGADLLFWGDVPVGSGLSSSAAIEVATATVLEALFGFHLAMLEKVHLTRAAENEFVGVPCGIMDQFVVVAARPNHALFLDCRSLDFEHVPFQPDGYELLIIDSGVERNLAASAYEERQRECAEGVRLLSRHNPRIQALRDVSIEELRARRSELPDPVFRRCRHVITENRRVLDAVAALRSGDIERLGSLLDDSHRSLRDDYEVSSEELDCLVESARSHPGVVGARLTGAGFGGCIIALVASQQIAAVQQGVGEAYFKRFHRRATFYTSRAAGGPAWQRL